MSEDKKWTKRGEATRYFREVVITHTADACLFWPYAKNSEGYGQLKTGSTKYVHRLACEHANGPPPTPDHEAAHSCGNGSLGCVAQRHLSWKTRWDNEHDKLIHGTHNRGERHGLSKLTEKEAREIRALKGKRSKGEVAKLFRVSRTTIHNVQNGVSWSWL